MHKMSQLRNSGKSGKKKIDLHFVLQMISPTTSLSPVLELWITLYKEVFTAWVVSHIMTFR
jgi:hypothetical protein